MCILHWNLTSTKPSVQVEHFPAFYKLKRDWWCRKNWDVIFRCHVLFRILNNYDVCFSGINFFSSKAFLSLSQRINLIPANFLYFAAIPSKLFSDQYPIQKLQSFAKNLPAIHVSMLKFCKLCKLHSILHNPEIKRCLKAISLNVVCFTFSLFLFQCLITTISFYL